MAIVKIEERLAIRKLAPTVCGDINRTMRHLAGLIFTLIFAFAASAQTAPDSPVLTALLNEFLEGASRNDPAVHDRFWAEDLIYTRSSGVRVGKADIMKSVRSAAPAKPDDPKSIYTSEDVIIQQYGTTAIVAFRLVSTTIKDGKSAVAYNLNTGTFLKRKGKWQVAAWQSTVVPKKEEPPH